jgi:hypothetical protein
VMQAFFGGPAALTGMVKRALTSAPLCFQRRPK